MKGTWKVGEEPNHAQTILGAIALALILLLAWVYGNREVTINTTITVSTPSASPSMPH